MMALRPLSRALRARALCRVLVATLLLACSATALGAQAPPTLTVSPRGPLRTITEAIHLAQPGARIMVSAGTYREPTILVDKPVVLMGDGEAVIDGEGERQIMTVTANDVTVRGLRFRNVGTSYVEDRAAIRVAGATNCTIVGNHFDDTFFGVYLAEVAGCRVEGNTFRGRGAGESVSGNAIHLWTSRDVTITGNRITGHRDGIYLEFARASVVRENVSEGNLRYGLHFMFSDSCRYERNTFARNDAGVAVMYAKVVGIHGNRFERNQGASNYGLLLKDIADAEITGNIFSNNSTALFIDGTDRMLVERNEFADNGWAVRLRASAQDSRFIGNNFVRNSFDVATNSRQNYSVFEGNYWDAYRGYDLDRDGTGDVPFRPVRLFSLLVEQHEPAVILMRSFLVDLLDAAERVLPVLTPAAMSDTAPSMRRVT